MSIRTGKWLSCGCCGTGFQTWEGYTDQDQDKGFGICEPCQESISADNEHQFDKAIAVLRTGLNETNRAKFDKCSRDKQKALVWQAMDDGILTWYIGRAS